MKTCESCGKEFEATRSYQKYCSKKCSMKYHNSIRKPKSKKDEIKVCLCCGKEFTSNRYFYCSKDCLRKATRQRDASIQKLLKSPYKIEVKAITKNCLGCGKPFNSVGKHNRMCDHCRDKGEYIDPHTVSLRDAA